MQADALLQRLQDDSAALQNLYVLIDCLAAPNTDREKRWESVCKFMGQSLPADTAQCSLQLLQAAGFSPVQYTEQVRIVTAQWELHAVSALEARIAC